MRQRQEADFKGTKKKSIKMWVFLALVILFFSPILIYSQSIQRGIGITIEVSGPSVPSDGGGWAPPPEVYAEVIFQGRAYPGALITILRNGKVAVTSIADISGDFSSSLSSVSAGISTFGIFAEDTEGRKSVTSSLTISIIGGTTTTIEGIFISPTIELSR